MHIISLINEGRLYSVKQFLFACDYIPRDQLQKEETIFCSKGTSGKIASKDTLYVFFYLILYIPVNNFSVCRDGSSWVEPVLSRGL